MAVSFAFLRALILCLARLRYFAFLLACLALPAHAMCMFAREAKPQDWYEWAEVLVAADVTGVEARGRMDVVSLRVVETFKGPQAAEAATLEVPNNLWATCRLERPVVGERVLGALNANNDALLIPLTADYADELRSAKPPSADSSAPR
jgi:hypothetical protein